MTQALFKEKGTRHSLLCLSSRWMWQESPTLTLMAGV